MFYVNYFYVIEKKQISVICQSHPGLHSMDYDSEIQRISLFILLLAHTVKLKVIPAKFKV